MFENENNAVENQLSREIEANRELQERITLLEEKFNTKNKAYAALEKNFRDIKNKNAELQSVLVREKDKNAEMQFVVKSLRNEVEFKNRQYADVFSKYEQLAAESEAADN